MEEMFDLDQAAAMVGRAKTTFTSILIRHKDQLPAARFNSQGRGAASRWFTKDDMDRIIEHCDLKLDKPAYKRQWTAGDL